MKEALPKTILVVCVVLTILCEPSKQIPLCRSGAGGCDGVQHTENDVKWPTFSSRYRAMEYDDAAMKLLMELLLKQHNSFPDEDLDSEDYENSSAIDRNEYSSIPPSSTKNILYGNNNASRNSEPETTIMNQNYSYQIDPLLYVHKNQRQTIDHSLGFQEKVFSNSFEELDSMTSMQHEPSGQLRSIVHVDVNNNRFDSIPPAHAEHINESSGNLLYNPTVTRTTDTSVSIRNMLSSKYRDSKRTTALNGSYSVLLRRRPFDGFIETLPLTSSRSSSSSLDIGNYREHYKEPTTRPKKTKINSLKPEEGNENGIQLEILNRPISADKPVITTPPGAGCENVTSCRQNNRKPMHPSGSKVKMGQKPAKIRMRTTKRRFFVKPGIHFPNKGHNSVAGSTRTRSLTPPPTVSVSTKSDGNLISSALASLSNSPGNSSEDENMMKRKT